MGTLGADYTGTVLRKGQEKKVLVFTCVPVHSTDMQLGAFVGEHEPKRCLGTCVQECLRRNAQVAASVYHPPHCSVH